MLGGGEQGERAPRLHEDVSKIIKQDNLEHDYVGRSSKYDSAHSREVLKMLESSVQPPTRQLSKNLIMEKAAHQQFLPLMSSPTMGQCLEAMPMKSTRMLRSNHDARHGENLDIAAPRQTL
jgi:hypothetical protein